MNKFIDDNKDNFEKEKNERLNTANLVAMKNVANGMTREQAEVFLKQLPLDMIFEELRTRIADLCDFKDKFDDLTLLSGKIRN